MDIAERIIQLNKIRGWSIYRLAREADVSPSTVANMLRRGTQPSIETLERICGAYNMTLGQFFMGEDRDLVQLTKGQREYLEVWSRLTSRQKKAVAVFMKGLLEM